jgi:hypothetical protein
VVQAKSAVARSQEAQISVCNETANAVLVTLVRRRMVPLYPCPSLVSVQFINTHTRRKVPALEKVAVLFVWIGKDRPAKMPVAGNGLLPYIAQSLHISSHPRYRLISCNFQQAMAHTAHSGLGSSKSSARQ